MAKSPSKPRATKKADAVRATKKMTRKQATKSVETAEGINEKREAEKVATRSGTQFGVGDVASLDSVEFATRRRNSDYQPIFDKLATLKKGQAFEVQSGEGITPAMAHNRLNAALRRASEAGRLPEPPKGLKLSKRTNTKGNIVFFLEEKKSN